MFLKVIANSVCVLNKILKNPQKSIMLDPLDLNKDQFDNEARNPKSKKRLDSLYQRKPLHHFFVETKQVSFVYPYLDLL